MLFSREDAAHLRFPEMGCYIVHTKLVSSSHLSQYLPDPCGTVGKLGNHTPRLFLHMFIDPLFLKSSTDGNSTTS